MQQLQARELRDGNIMYGARAVRINGPCCCYKHRKRDLLTIETRDFADHGRQQRLSGQTTQKDLCQTQATSVVSRWKLTD